MIPTTEQGMKCKDCQFITKSVKIVKLSKKSAYNEFKKLNANFLDNETCCYHLNMVCVYLTFNH